MADYIIKIHTNIRHRPFTLRIEDTDIDFVQRAINHIRDCGFLDGWKEVSAIEVQPKNIIYFSWEKAVFRFTRVFYAPLRKESVPRK